MVSVDKLTHKFGQLDDFLSVLAEMRNVSLEAFLKDKILIGEAKYYLQISIECCLDIANHIISSESFRSPKDFADSFTVPEEKAVLEQGLTQNLKQMAKFRNRLVHLYGQIDDVAVLEFIHNDLGDLKKIKTAIASKFLKK